MLFLHPMTLKCYQKLYENEENCAERGPGHAPLSLSGSAKWLLQTTDFFYSYKGWADKSRAEEKLYPLHLRPLVILRSNMDFPL